MARKTFSWGNLPSPLLRALQEDLALDGDAAAALRAAYGSRPSPDFVRAAWVTLRDRWLQRDRRARLAVVDDLRQRRLGDLSIKVTNASGQMQYLRSCRNSAALRDVVAAALDAAGATPPPELAERVIDHTVADDAAAITLALLEHLRAATGSPALALDDDGDIPMQFGSAMVFVRAFADPPIVRVFSPILAEVGLGVDLLDAINELNAEHFFTKWFVTDGVLIACVDVFGTPLVADHVLHACGVVGEIAGSLDEELQDRFGGRTFFGEWKGPKPVPGTGGYL